MATGWSNDYNVIRITDFFADKMAVDYTGSVVLLAGHKKYGIIEIFKSLNNKYPKSCKYKINAVEWNQTFHNQHICTIAYNTKLQLLYWENNIDLVNSTKLSSHTQSVSDINWHSSHPFTLASASVDSFIHIWDIRVATRPVLSLSSVYGASLVGWNHLTQHLLATSHSGNVNIWDQRNISHPINYITAHLNSVQYLDWSRINVNQLVTCCQDCTVKFFDINNIKKPVNILNIVAPVWRVKCTPYNDGILKVLISPDKKVDNNLLLWNFNSFNVSVHTFIGNSDTILECHWLNKYKDGQFEYEIITWSKDQTIRLWYVVPYLQKKSMDHLSRVCTDNLDIYCNIQNSETNNATDIINSENEVQDDNLNISFDNNSYNSENGEEQFTTNLQREFFTLNVDSEVFIKKKDLDQRMLLAVVKINNSSLSVHITFPFGYPENVKPHFKITECTYDPSMINTIHKVLYDAAMKQVAKNQMCVQYCLHELVVYLKKTLISFSDSQLDENTYSLDSQSSPSFGYGSFYKSIKNSYNMIRRKTIGLKFSNNGALLFFNNPPQRNTNVFRSLLLQGIQNKKNIPLQKCQPFWLDNNKRSLINLKTDKPIIVIYDVSSLFPINFNLASKYDLDTNNVFNTCMKNASITNRYKRKDLVQTWLLAAYACNTSYVIKKNETASTDEDNDYKSHPFTKEMMDSLISHYTSCSDFQTAALLCCVNDPKPAFKNIESDETPVNTRSNRPSECLNFPQREQEITECFEICDQGLVLKYSSSTKDIYYNEYKRRYMDILDNLGLLDHRAKVKNCLKYQTQISGAFKFKFMIDCDNCKSSVEDKYCSQCQQLSLKCAICNTTVRGTARICLKCGHGGHTDHLTGWFDKESSCALNCGCCCLFETIY